MRTLITLGLVLFLTVTSFAQRTRTDSLINNMRNTGLRGVCHYVWLLEMPDKNGRELVKIGKPATPALLAVLTDRNKGIIAHYFLSNIWTDTISQSSSFANYQKDSSVHYTYNGLDFFERDGEWFASDPDLQKIKLWWCRMLKEKMPEACLSL